MGRVPSLSVSVSVVFLSRSLGARRELCDSYRRGSLLGRKLFPSPVYSK